MQTLPPEVDGPVGLLLLIGMIAWGVGITVFWMYVGWRAMSAHERLADTAQQTARSLERLSRNAPSAGEMRDIAQAQKRRAADAGEQGPHPPAGE